MGPAGELPPELVGTWTATLFEFDGNPQLIAPGQRVTPIIEAGGLYRVDGVEDGDPSLGRITVDGSRIQFRGGDLEAVDAFTQRQAGGRALVANTGSNSVSTIVPGTLLTLAGPQGIRAVLQQDAATADILGLGTGPVGIIATADASRAYVANGSSSNVSVIDITAGTVTDTIEIGDGPNGMALGPDGSSLYVTNFISNTVSVIATATDSLVGTIDVGEEPVWVAVAPDGVLA